VKAEKMRREGTAEPREEGRPVRRKKEVKKTTGGDRGSAGKAALSLCAVDEIGYEPVEGNNGDS